jgi:hypothetical protein
MNRGDAEQVREFGGYLMQTQWEMDESDGQAQVSIVDRVQRWLELADVALRNAPEQQEEWREAA